MFVKLTPKATAVSPAATPTAAAPTASRYHRLQDDEETIDDNETTTAQPQPGSTSFSAAVYGVVFKSEPPIRSSTGIHRAIPKLDEVEYGIQMHQPSVQTATTWRSHRQRWPGILLCGFVCLLAVVSITVGAHNAHTASVQRRDKVQRAIALEKCIASGQDCRTLRDDDGVVNNPKVYPSMGCELPNYQSKNGKLWAVSNNGTRVPLAVKGVNWFGMETGQQVPFGLWDNDQNGTTVYAIADFLSLNNFNSVRIPLCVQNILANSPIQNSLINSASNRALDLSSYLALLRTVVQALGYRSISVMISMHTLNIMNSDGSLWYGKTTTVDDFLKAIDMVTGALCSDAYWNVLGLDVKNEPFEGTWGSGFPNDFKLGAELIANRMLKGCPKWVAFVEGVNQQNTIVLDGQEYGYYDWFGGGLHNARQYPVQLATPNKLVYAPHYYTPAVFPQYYLFGGGTVGAGNAIIDFVELSDDALSSRIMHTMNDMFGFLNDHKGPAVLLGEFAGLYTTDAHPMKTTQRCTDFTIQRIVQDGYAGGYMWSLNPESAYQYNPADTTGNFVEGLLELDWRTANMPFLNAMKGLDAMPDLKPAPCFPITLSS
ncbi:Aste57867_14821 [Aphanomyces stellatus]|uniref:Aste57867_14821 protein n=1 Tax=Aphanomyces stellatus TaxID=120398 RepID=A0A485L1P2_9STRA|nr:hypothetical protein As57867_014765 [Aphanomyces stellatus]VFT91639.1 Aste57867_14821 [Aphanomyces stellatus]